MSFPPPKQMLPTTAQGIDLLPLRFLHCLRAFEEDCSTAVSHHFNTAERNTYNSITVTPVLHRVGVTSAAGGLTRPHPLMSKMRRTPTQIQQLPLLQRLLVHLPNGKDKNIHKTGTIRIEENTGTTTNPTKRRAARLAYCFGWINTLKTGLL